MKPLVVLAGPIHADGIKQLETEAASWQRLIDAIALILGMADGGAR